MEEKMKNLARLIIPTMILAVLVLATGSLAFAKEFGFLGRSGTEIEFTGVVNTMNTGSMTVNGTAITLTTSTEMESTIAVGDEVRVHTQRSDDGQLTAREVALLNPASSTGLGSPSFSSSMDDSRTGEVEVVGTLESMLPEVWIISGQAFAITASTEIKASLLVGDQVKVNAFMSTTGVLTAREIELFTGDNNDDNDDGEFEFSGVVESISTDSWTIGGQTVTITGGTEIDGSVMLGVMVVVEGMRNVDGTLTAREIEFFDDVDDDDFGDDDDHDDNFGDDDEDDWDDDDDGDVDDDHGGEDRDD